jgi:hypothetical protein
MSSVFEIPLTGVSQRFGITLANVRYILTVRWNSKVSSWFLDIADSGNIPVLSGIPLVTGVDLLEQFEYLGLGGQLFVQTDGDAQAIPTYENLGTSSHLYFVVP